MPLAGRCEAAAENAAHHAQFKQLGRENIAQQQHANRLGLVERMGDVKNYEWRPRQAVEQPAEKRRGGQAGLAMVRSASQRFQAMGGAREVQIGSA
jgi:hypothetical protein